MSIFQARSANTRKSTLRQRVRSRKLSAEALENRRLLAGDVDVFVRRGDLVVVGDRADNSVELRVESSGNVVAVGRDGTTVNGSEAPVVVLEGSVVSDDLRVQLGRGNDSILIDGVEITDDFYVAGAQGDDAVGLLRTTVGDDVYIRDTRGELSVSIDLSTIDDDLRIIGSRESDTIVVDESRVGDDTWLWTSSGDDTIVVNSSVHQDDVFVSTGRGDDNVVIVDTEIGDDVRALLGSGDDNLVIEDSSLGDRVLALGGAGSDALDLVGDVELNSHRRPLLFSFGSEREVDSAAVVDAAIAELVESGARRPTLVDIASGNDDFSTLVSLIIQGQLLDAVSGSAPLTVFAPTNTAFANFIEEFNLTVDENGALEVPLELLQTVLTFHVAAGNVDSGIVASAEPIETLQGESISVQPETLVLDGRASLVAIDIRARNGIIHVIDTVLTPSVLDPTPELA